MATNSFGWQALSEYSYDAEIANCSYNLDIGDGSVILTSLGKQIFFHTLQRPGWLHTRWPKCCISQILEKIHLVLDSVYFVFLMHICTSTCKRGAKMKHTTKVEVILNDAIVLVKPAASEHSLSSGLEAFMTSWVSSSRPTTARSCLTFFHAEFETERQLQRR